MAVVLKCPLYRGNTVTSVSWKFGLYNSMPETMKYRLIAQCWPVGKPRYSMVYATSEFAPWEAKEVTLPALAMPLGQTCLVLLVVYHILNGDYEDFGAIQFAETFVIATR